MVIVQHVCTVTIFLCCFTAIYLERVSPVTIVGVGSACTVIGWVLWDTWVTKEEAAKGTLEAAEASSELQEDGSSTSSGASTTASMPSKEPPKGLGLTLQPTSPTMAQKSHLHSASPASMHTNASGTSSTATSHATGHPTGAPTFATYSYYPPYGEPVSSLSPRNQQRLATVKSAVLIYSALLGLSPILKSLTKSTTSDTIWAMSCWLMCINLFFFDYGGGVGAK